MNLSQTTQPTEPGNIYRGICYSLVAGMMLCAMLTVVSFVSHAINIPGWQPTGLAGLYLIAIFSSLLTHRLSRKLTVMSKKWYGFFSTTIISVLLLTKIAIGLSHGWSNFLREMRHWGERFPSRIFDPETIFTLVMITIIWILSDQFAALIEAIGINQIEEVPVRQQMINLLAMLGSALIIFTLLERIDLVSLFSNAPSTQPEIPLLARSGTTTLLYCVLGIILLNQTQYTSLNMRWQLQEIPVHRQFAKQWTAYSLLFLGLMLFVTSMLPSIQNPHPILSVPSYKVTSTQPTRLPPPPIPERESMFTKMKKNFETLSGIPSFDLGGLLNRIQRIVSWVIVISLGILSVQQLLLNYQSLIEKLRSLPGWGWLAKWLEWLQGLFTQLKGDVKAFAVGGLERMSQLAPGENGWGGFMNLRKLTPRQQIYFFYLAFARRAGEKGLPRSLHQTPDEYAATLQNSLPAAAEDIHALTDAFVRARYSRQPVETEDSQRVESIWNRLRNMLKGRKK